MTLKEIRAYAERNGLDDSWWTSDGESTSERCYTLDELESIEGIVYLLNSGEEDNWLELTLISPATKPLTVAELLAYSKKRQLKDKWWVSDGRIASEETYSLSEIGEQESIIYLRNVADKHKWLALAPTLHSSEAAPEEWGDYTAPAPKEAEEGKVQVRRPERVQATPTTRVGRQVMKKEDEEAIHNERRAVWIIAFTFIVILLGGGCIAYYSLFIWEPPDPRDDIAKLNAGEFGLRVTQVQHKQSETAGNFSIHLVDSGGNVHVWNAFGDNIETRDGRFVLRGVDIETGKVIVSKRHPQLAGIIIKSLSLDPETLELFNQTRGQEIDDYLSTYPRPPQLKLNTLLAESVNFNSQLNSSASSLKKEMKEIDRIYMKYEMQPNLKGLKVPDRFVKRKEEIESDIERVDSIIRKSRVRVSEIRSRMRLTLPN